MVSEWRLALTSAHHVLAASLAAARSAKGMAGDHQVGLGVADQVLHDALGLRVRGLAPVRQEPVMGRETHVFPGRDDLVRDHPALQAAHPVSEHLHRHPAQLLQALR